MARWAVGAVAVGLIGLVAGCSGDDSAPSAPGNYVAWAKMWPDQAVRKVQFEHPSNWPVTTSRRHGGSARVSPTDSEWWLLEYHPDQAKLGADAILDLAQKQRLAEFPNLLTEHRAPIDVNEHAGRQVNYEILGGQANGVLIGLDGGWVIEYRYRPDYRKQVVPAFQHLISSLDLVENR